MIQAEMVKTRLEQNSDLHCEIVSVSSKGDRNPDQALSELGAGSFSSELNHQILDGNIDIGVHSCKDLPSMLEEGITLAAVLERASWKDLIIYKENAQFLEESNWETTIATGSARRKAQWLSKHPNHRLTQLRGNIETRLRKLEESNWQGIIMAEAAIQRLNITGIYSRQLHEFLPAPCQGTIAVVCLTNSPFLENMKALNDPNNFLVTTIERDFIRELGIDCDTPLGLLVEIKSNTLELKAELFSGDGKKVLRWNESCGLEDVNDFGRRSAGKYLQAGAKEMLQHG